MQLGAENVAIFKGFDSTALKPRTIKMRVRAII